MAVEAGAEEVVEEPAGREAGVVLPAAELETTGVPVVATQ